MRWFRADLHIHSVLSPCASLEMGPNALMQTALTKGLDMLAITDHNSLANCEAYARVARRYGLVLIWGAEVQTMEEIHLVTLFPGQQEAMAFHEKLGVALPDIPNNPDFFGDQPIIDAEENIIGFEEKALINSLLWSLDETVEQVRGLGGYCFPAHIDAGTFSLISQIGFIPEHLGFNMVEVSTASADDSVRQFLAHSDRYRVLRNSDAHQLEEVAKVSTEYLMEQPTFAGLVDCFADPDRVKPQPVYRPFSRG